MFVNGFLKLIEAGIVRREVFGDAALQRILNEGGGDARHAGAAARRLLDAQRIRARAGRGPRVPAALRHLPPEVRLDGGTLICDEAKAANDLRDEAAFETISANMLGSRRRTASS